MTSCACFLVPTKRIVPPWATVSLTNSYALSMYVSDCCRSMMWMPLRSVRMKRLTFGFHRRVWCPKWTPLSSSWRMVTTAMAVLLFWRGIAPLAVVFAPDRIRPASLVPGTRPPAEILWDRWGWMPRIRVVDWMRWGHAESPRRAGCRPSVSAGDSSPRHGYGLLSHHREDRPADRRRRGR